jgi:hypothetical protein
MQETLSKENDLMLIDISEKLLEMGLPVSEEQI